ncbi:hypothetical protein ZIOFF_069103 [Zingiber officinale]|uniref:mRNA cap-binding protein n=1 Tax=Zingiber officinale TaxID=94328 RepID=A0A8J5CBA8_ZINOF|nr:hypothetical protein ZIOFF_069103 [Zingiber officinale]
MEHTEEADIKGSVSPPPTDTTEAAAETESDVDERDRYSREIKAGLHPLKFSNCVQYKFVFWYSRRTPGVRSQTSYEDNIKKIVEFSTDAANRNGGKWILQFKKVVFGKICALHIMALVGNQLDFGDDVCGAVLSIRLNEDILSVWNRNASDQKGVMALRDSIKRHLKLPQSYLMEYKPHDASLRDNSSYRNTWLRG